jgi:hypothetical protein
MLTKVNKTNALMSGGKGVFSKLLRNSYSQFSTIYLRLVQTLKKTTPPHPHLTNTLQLTKIYVQNNDLSTLQVGSRLNQILAMAKASKTWV